MPLFSKLFGDKQATVPPPPASSYYSGYYSDLSRNNYGQAPPQAEPSFELDNGSDQGFTSQSFPIVASGYGTSAKSSQPTSSSANTQKDTRFHVEKYWLPPSTTPPMCLPCGYPSRGCNNGTQFTLVIDKSTTNYPGTSPLTIPITKSESSSGSEPISPCPNFPVYINGVLINGGKNGGNAGNPQFHNCYFYNFGCDDMTRRERKRSRVSSTSSTPKQKSTMGYQSSGSTRKSSSYKEEEKPASSERSSKNIIFRDEDLKALKATQSRIDSFKSLYYY